MLGPDFDQISCRRSRLQNSHQCIQGNLTYTIRFEDLQPASAIWTAEVNTCHWLCVDEYRVQLLPKYTFSWSDKWLQHVKLSWTWLLQGKFQVCGIFCVEGIQEMLMVAIFGLRGSNVDNMQRSKSMSDLCCRHWKVSTSEVKRTAKDLCHRHRCL